MRECADIIADTDMRMEKISRELRNLNNKNEQYAWQDGVERSYDNKMEKEV